MQWVLSGAVLLALSKVARASEMPKVDKSTLKVNKPRRLPKGSRKEFIVRARQNGRERIVRFGDPKMPNRPSDPKRRANFRARHNCKEKKNKLKAGYWACKKW